VAKGSPDELLEHYVDGIPEPLESKILVDSSLRIHLLGLIATSSTFSPFSEEKIGKFFSQTFGGLSDDDFENKILKQLKKLKKYGMITGEGSFKPTDFGKKVFWLRIDPKTAFDIATDLDHYLKGHKHTFGILHMITNLPEFYPKPFYLGNLAEPMEKLIRDKKDDEKLYARQEFVIDDPEEEEEEGRKAICGKSLLVLHHWIHDMTRKELSNQFNSEPGDQFQISQNAEQLAYVIREIARFWKNKDLVREIDTLRQRIRHGISEKYLELVGLKNVGRVRAKALYKENFKNYADLRKAPLEKLAEIDNISMTIAKSIKSQV